GAVVGHIHDLEIRVAALEPFLVAAQCLFVDAELLLPGRHHPLAGVIVIAGPQVAVPRRRAAAFRRRLVARMLPPLGDGAPLFPPGFGLLDALVQALHDPVDLAQRHRAIGGHALGDERRVRPDVLLRKAMDPVAVVEHQYLRYNINTSSRETTRRDATPRCGGRARNPKPLPPPRTHYHPPLS